MAHSRDSFALDFPYVPGKSNLRHDKDCIRQEKTITYLMQEIDLHNVDFYRQLVEMQAAMTSMPTSSLKEIPISVWIVEDSSDYRRTVVDIVNAYPGLCCTGDFDSTEKLLESLNSKIAPDVFLVDIGLPGLDGVSCVERLRRITPRSEIVMLTIHEDNDTIFRALCAGAAGYLPKTSSAEEICQAVATVHRGGAAMNSQIARRVLTLFTQFSTPAWDYGLTIRERETLEHLVNGKSKPQIAETLCLSVHTIDSHVRSVYAKLEVHSRSDAVVKALRERLV